MFRKFLNDVGGNYAAMTALAIVPIMGALALGVDYTMMTNQRQMTLNALDAANIATARYIAEGATDQQALTYARQYFDANLGSLDPALATLDVTLPSTTTGGGTLKMSAKLKYKPYFMPTFEALLGKNAETVMMLNFEANSEVKLKNTLEVALVLDNSGSMDFIGTGSGKKRIVLLREAAKQLIDTLAAQAVHMKQVNKPVQFALVPFAASVNVGPENATESWMDVDGRSPIHHENFDWTSFKSANTGDNRTVQLVGGVYYKKGSDWLAAENEKVTRFTLYKDLQRVVGQEFIKTGEEYVCTKKSGRKCTAGYYKDIGYNKDIPAPFASWGGCVEARPYPYNVNDATPTTATPATLFVPMFAPDETDLTDSSSRPANNNWWLDDRTGTGNSKARLMYMPKYYKAAPQGKAAMGMDEGPNTSCSTKPITPLKDVTDVDGMQAIKKAIDEMEPNGATNVPEGMAWGWRTLSSKAPFTGGRPETEKGNDKVVIVLTDGANTYYTPSSVVAQSYSGTYYEYGGNDLAGTKAIYSAYGYTAPPNGAAARLFDNTTATKTDYSNANYTKALNDQFATLCANAKASNIMVITVSLDLSETNTTEKAQMDALKACSSDARYRKDPSDPTKPAKLYWNANGGNLADKFKEIADELSNLRIIS